MKLLTSNDFFLAGLSAITSSFLSLVWLAANLSLFGDSKLEALLSFVFNELLRVHPRRTTNINVLGTVAFPSKSD